MRVGSVDVVDDDRQMLKPKIVASAVRRVRKATFGELDKRDLFRAQTHSHFFRDACQAEGRAIEGAATYRPETYRVAIEFFSAIEVAHHAGDPRNPRRIPQDWAFTKASAASLMAFVCAG